MSVKSTVPLNESRHRFSPEVRHISSLLNRVLTDFTLYRSQQVVDSERLRSYTEMGNLLTTRMCLITLEGTPSLGQVRLVGGQSVGEDASVGSV